MEKTIKPDKIYTVVPRLRNTCAGYELPLSKHDYSLNGCDNNLGHIPKSIMFEIVNSLDKELEAKIIEALKQHGYEFKTRFDLLYFAETKCEIANYTFSGNKILMVDKRLICEWCYDYELLNSQNKVECSTLLKFKVL